MWKEGRIHELWDEATSLQKPQPRQKQQQKPASPPSQATFNARRSLQLIRDGQFSRAAEALTSEGLDFETPEALSAMRDKHPQELHPPSPPQEAPSAAALQLSRDQVSQGVRSFRTGSAPGPSGLRSEHLKAAVYCPTAARADKCLVALTNVTNLLVQGKCPTALQDSICGANLFAARKKHGGHQVMRLASKCLSAIFALAAAERLKPLQMGVKVAGGCEAVIHAANALFHDNSINASDKWILQVDMQNAFNLVDRETIFKEVGQHHPEMAAWVEYCYGCHLALYFRTTTIHSCTGVHPGDPLGSLLFVLALQPLAQKIKDTVPDLLLNT
jgi:hypothetical protein